MSLIAKFAQLNDADLSRLSARLAQLRAEMERELQLQGVSTAEMNRPMSALEINMMSQQTGISANELIATLEAAQRMGLY